MNTKNRILKMLSLLTLMVSMSGCSRPQDLDTPCPDYGKQCSQALINT